MKLGIFADFNRNFSLDEMSDSLPNPITTDALLFRGNMDDSDRLFSVSEIQAFTGAANDYSDGILSPEENVDVPFCVCLQSKDPFRFFVNVLGKADAAKKKIRIEANIDGRSQIILSENTAQWHHLDYAAPDRLDFRDEPTVINGVDWFPVWPDIPDEENRDCDCFSDVFEEVSLSLPFAETDIVLKAIRSRNVTKIVQFPTNENDFELIIEFDDNAPGGSDDYIAEIEFTPVEP